MAEINDKMAHSLTSKPHLDLWRRFIESHPEGNVFHTPEMADIFKRARRHKPSVFACVNGKKEITSLALGVQVKMFNSLHSRMVSRCICYGGILQRAESGRDDLTQIIDSFEKESKKKSLFTEIRNTADTSAFKADMISRGYNYFDYLNYLVPQNREAADIFRDFSSSRRLNIKRLERQGISVEEVQDRSGVAKVYDILRSTYYKIQVPLADFSLFEGTFDVMKPLGMAKFYLARLEKEAIASAVALLYKKTIHLWYIGTRNKFLKISPVCMILWHLMKLKSQNGYHTLDFLGSGRPTEQNGVREFRRRFGGKPVNYGRYQKIYSPFLLKLSEKA